MRVALVAGAGSRQGIGVAVARALGGNGCRVVLADVNGPGAEANAARLRAEGMTAAGRALDATDAAAVAEAFQQVRSDWGPVQILVHLVGVTHGESFLDLAEADWERLLRTNLTSAFICAQAAARQMVETGWGRIITVTSVSAQRGGGIFGGCHYTASKAGLAGFTQAIARELAPRGITCNAVSPGIIETEISTDPRLLARRQRLLPEVPLGRLGAPDDVAALVAFLASDAAAYVTGAVYDVNGGFHIH